MDYHLKTDEELVAQCRIELPYNTAAYSEILRRYESMVYRTCNRILGDLSDAEEASQDAFIRLHDKIQLFDERALFKTWFYRMVFNIALRKKQSRDIKYEKNQKYTRDYLDEESVNKKPLQNKNVVMDVIEKMKKD